MVEFLLAHGAGGLVNEADDEVDFTKLNVYALV